jgi:hypothetical protein
VAYEFTGFFARPSVPQPAALPQGAVWREIATPFVGVGVWLAGSDARLLPPAQAEALARQLGLDAAECWVYLTYVCWGGQIDFVYGLGSRRLVEHGLNVPFGPIKEDAQQEVDAAFTGLME